MSWFKLLRHDLRCGLLRWRYPVAALAVVFSCLLFFNRMNIREVVPSWMDYVLASFQGSPPVDSGLPQDVLSLPYDWLLTVGACLFINLDYMLLDLTNNGQQVIVRSRSRRGWFLSKCAWNLAATALYLLLVGFVILMFTLITGGTLSPENTGDGYLMTFGWAGFEPALFSPWETLLLGLGLPYLTLAALSILEMTLCLVVRPVISFFLCIAMLILAIYVDSPFVLGNGAMAARSSLIAETGQPPLAVALTCLAVIAVCMIAGSAIFKRSDVLGSKE